MFSEKEKKVIDEFKKMGIQIEFIQPNNISELKKRSWVMSSRHNGEIAKFSTRKSERRSERKCY